MLGSCEWPTCQRPSPENENGPFVYTSMDKPGNSKGIKYMETAATSHMN